MSTCSKIFLTYTVLLAGVIMSIHRSYTPEIEECGLTVVQYDEQKNVYFYEIQDFRQEFTPQPKETSIRVGMPVSYVIYGKEGRNFEGSLKTLSREQWEEDLIKSHREGCLCAFVVFWLLGGIIWGAHWSEDAKTIIVPVVGDR